METKETACCFTGYRPQKFPFPLSDQNPDYIRFENRLLDAVAAQIRNGCTVFYSGMAMGFDLIAAETVLLFRDGVAAPKIRLIAAVPFPEQAEKYPPEWKKRYDRVLAAADERITVCKRYETACYQKRNMYMVDHSGTVITWFDGRPSGTANTLRYAKKENVTILNLNADPDFFSENGGYDFVLNAKRHYYFRKRGNKNGQTRYFMAVKGRTFSGTKGNR